MYREYNIAIRDCTSTSSSPPLHNRSAHVIRENAANETIFEARNKRSSEGKKTERNVRLFDRAKNSSQLLRRRLTVLGCRKLVRKSFINEQMNQTDHCERNAYALKLRRLSERIAGCERIYVVRRISVVRMIITIAHVKGGGSLSIVCLPRTPLS